MRKLLMMLLALATLSCNAKNNKTDLKSDTKIIKLKSPKFDTKISLYEAMQNRKSARRFSQKEIDDQDLSNLLWAAAGVNRRNGGRTVPLLGGIDVHIAMESGVYLYLHKEHALKQVLNKDIRAELSSQGTVKKAPLVFILSITDSSFPIYMKMAMKKEQGMDFYYGNQVAYSTQNIYLYAGANQMNSVVIGSLYTDKIKKYLNFKKDQHPYLLHLVGYSPKKNK
ncbi:MAG: nitroreductase family protein [Marinifilaceae bacterium]|jgi:nitroreductase|nr:nitroreductase family protein [Marinifilaceae bacterium]